MRAVAITPGQAGSIRLIDAPEPSLDGLAGGRGVLVRVLQVGLDGTDREIYHAEYGRAPEDNDYLICGHECLGQVAAVGAEVRSLQVGDLVVPTVRRPGQSIYDRIGRQDLTTDEFYYERGISFLHGYFCERFVEDEEHLIAVPGGLREIGLLLEPLSVAEKAWHQASEVQRRLQVWRPQRAAVMGAGPMGLLSALVLRLRGLEVSVFSREADTARNAELVRALGAQYRALTGDETELQSHGQFDLIIEFTGYSPLAFASIGLLARNGVLVLGSITGGHRQTTIPSDALNLNFVLGNKAMIGCVNSVRRDFEAGVLDMALAQVRYPGWLASLMTDPVAGIERYQDVYDRLLHGQGVIKAFCQVAEAAGTATPAAVSHP